MYLDQLHRLAFRGRGLKEEEGGFVVDLKVEEYHNKKVDCLHSEK